MPDISIQENLIISEAGVDSLDTLSGGTASASSVYTGVAANACDNSMSTQWNTISAHPQWWKYDYGSGNAKIINKLVIKASSTTYTRTPRDFLLEASNTGSFTGEQVTLLNVTMAVFSASEIKTWYFNNDTAYRYYRIYITETVHGSYTELQEVEFMTVWPSGKIDNVPASDIAETIKFDESIEYQLQESFITVSINFQEEISANIGTVQPSISDALNFKESGPLGDLLPVTDSITNPSAKSVWGTYYPYRACDNDLGADSAWYTIGAHPQWWQYDFGAGNEKIICRLRMYGDSNQCPRDFTLLASNTGSFGGEEVTLLTVSGITDWDTNPRWVEWEVTNSTSYRYYRINITETEHGSYTLIREIELTELGPCGEVGDVKASVSETINFQEVNLETGPAPEIAETIYFEISPVGKVGTVPAEVSETIRVYDEDTTEASLSALKLFPEETIKIDSEISGQLDALGRETETGIEFGEAPVGGPGTVLTEVEDGILDFEEYVSYEIVELRQTEVFENLFVDDETTRRISEVKPEPYEAGNFEIAIDRQITQLQRELSGILDFNEDQAFLFQTHWGMDGLLDFAEDVEASPGTVKANVSETVRFEESLDRLIGEQFRNISLSEGLVFAESPTRQVGDIERDNIFDNLRIEESPIRAVGHVQPVAEENVNFEEQADTIVSVPVFVQENLYFEEDMTRNMAALGATISEVITMAEDLSRKLSDLTIPILEENVNLQEDLKPAVATLSMAVTEALELAEGMAFTVSATGIHIFTEVKVGYTGVVKAMLEDLRTEIQELVSMAESPATEKFGPVLISIVENINFSESKISQIRLYSPALYKEQFVIGEKNTVFEIPGRQSEFILPKGELL